MTLPCFRCDRPGVKYRHFKGGVYEVLNMNVPHTETSEPLVLYRDIWGTMYARPYKIFFGEVEQGGCMVPRFTKIK